MLIISILALQACTSQDASKCTTDDSACATKTGHTSELGCSVPASGYWLDDGMAVACLAQSGCASGASIAGSCTTGLDVTKLKCSTLEAGYWADADGMISGVCFRAESHAYARLRDNADEHARICSP